jgi:hypothetical protein
LTTDPSKNSSKEQTYRPDKRTRRREVKTQTRKCGGREFLRVHDSRSVTKMAMRKQEGKKQQQQQQQ